MTASVAATQPEVQLRLKDYLDLYGLALKRLQSQAAYHAFQAAQASMLLRYLSGHGVVVTNRALLDLGSGIGGYSRVFGEAGARVTSLDLMADRISSQEYGAAVSASATAIPLADNSFDIVFCASLIEHVEKPEAVIAEIERVLKPGGICYLSFPPFYSPRGGHEYAPFHYFGENIALRLVGKRAMKYHPEWLQDLYQVSYEPTSFSKIYADWGLYVMTIGKARTLIESSRLDLIDLSTRYMPVSFVRWPILGEFLTWHVQFLLSKPGALPDLESA